MNLFVALNGLLCAGFGDGIYTLSPRNPLFSTMHHNDCLQLLCHNHCIPSIHDAMMLISLLRVQSVGDLVFMLSFMDF